MDTDDAPRRAGDDLLRDAVRIDLYDHSVADLEERIAILKAEIARCEAMLAKQGALRAEAESLFRS